MSSFNVPDMSCGHCTATIEKAIKAIDPTATVACDLDTRTVSVESFLSDRAVSEAIRNAGYDVAVPAAG
ncbi:copper chaperone [Rhodobacteraceae bacterium 2CG4]|uniref:Copper chaperone n=1 Tax=Halovulum marinum TaxID=2662447 RepID=A0A6L5YXS7_9RHOB|nr:heavy-metal-associated domain-containing protein [Halovulum marinum]MSU88484.1 copper chaperone [Halovulum marinum]